jgi:hypothetical protein
MELAQNRLMTGFGTGGIKSLSSASLVLITSL